MALCDVMTERIVSVEMDDKLEVVKEIFDTKRFHHLLVVDENDGFRGMISVQDLLRVIALDEKARADLMEALIFPQR